jgi:hypothetical protein
MERNRSGPRLMDGPPDPANLARGGKQQKEHIKTKAWTNNKS